MELSCWQVDRITGSSIDDDDDDPVMTDDWGLPQLSGALLEEAEGLTQSVGALAGGLDWEAEGLEYVLEAPEETPEDGTKDGDEGPEQPDEALTEPPLVTGAPQLLGALPDIGEARGLPQLSGADEDGDGMEEAMMAFACWVATICFIIS